MEISFEKSGGFAYFPGLAQSVTVDTQKLAAPTAQRLMDLVQRAAFFSLPSSLPAPAGSADHYSYTLTVHDGLRQHTVTLTDPITDANLSQLIDELQRIVP
jgi:hypothetical protein